MFLIKKNETNWVSSSYYFSINLFYGTAKAQYWLFVDKENNFLVLLVLNIPTILFMAIYIYYKKRNEKSSIMKSK